MRMQAFPPDRAPHADRSRNGSRPFAAAGAARLRASTFRSSFLWLGLAFHVATMVAWLSNKYLTVSPEEPAGMAALTRVRHASHACAASHTGDRHATASPFASPRAYAGSRMTRLSQRASLSLPAFVARPALRPERTAPRTRSSRTRRIPSRAPGDVHRRGDGERRFALGHRGRKSAQQIGGRSAHSPGSALQRARARRRTGQCASGRRAARRAVRAFAARRSARCNRRPANASR